MHIEDSDAEEEEDGGMEKIANQLFDGDDVSDHARQCANHNLCHPKSTILIDLYFLLHVLTLCLSAHPLSSISAYTIHLSIHKRNSKFLSMYFIIL